MYIDKVPPEDRHLIQVGYVFEWTIAKKNSSIKFKPEVFWTQEELDNIKVKVEELKQIWSV